MNFSHYHNIKGSEIDMKQNRKFTEFITPNAETYLNALLLPTSTKEYQNNMMALGGLLADVLLSQQFISVDKKVLVVSTAEDADFLQAGVSSELQANNINIKRAIFWNNHYQLANKTSVAPIVNKFLENGYQDSTDIVIVKSIMSGSCVVKTNLLALFDYLENMENIFILAPVMHKNSAEKLRAEFPQEIADKFRFICFAIDEIRTDSGEVQPGIGGIVYQRLGLNKPPVETGYMPDTIKNLLIS